jgi:hypothetical protein
MKQSCKVCFTRRQRNLVNAKSITDFEDNYVCLECLLFPQWARSKYPTRYYEPYRQPIKIILNKAREKLPEVTPMRDKQGYYILDELALRELREALKDDI